MDRSAFSTLDTVSHIWAELGLPADAVKSLHLQGQGNGLPSSFKVGHLAQASIALSALTARSIPRYAERPPITQSHCTLRTCSNRVHL